MNVARGQLEELLPLAGREDHTSLTLPHELDMAEIENEEQLETQKPRQILPKLHSFKELERPVVEPQRHQERLQLAGKNYVFTSITIFLLLGLTQS